MHYATKLTPESDFNAQTLLDCLAAALVVSDLLALFARLFAQHNGLQEKTQSNGHNGQIKAFHIGIKLDIPSDSGFGSAKILSSLA